jgi:equilibrative nucleoside transporter 1/2/3
MAASPYFHRRFIGSTWIRLHFQSAILSVSTITNLVSIFVLTKRQHGASYTKRITYSLLVNLAVFTLLALSTFMFTSISAGAYLAFLLLMVFFASFACGLSQNGAFAYASGFGRPEYTQALMTGQAVAGVLPCVAQIVTVLAFPEPADESGSIVNRILRLRSSGEISTQEESFKSALWYFLTATFVSGITLVSFLLLLRRHAKHRSRAVMSQSIASVRSLASTAPILQPPRISTDSHNFNSSSTAVSLWTLFSKLRYLSIALFLCFGITIVFPVFTESVVSVRGENTTDRLFQPEAFIPIAFLFWNSGDLIGRLSTLYIPIPSSRVLLLAAISRIIFPPLYFLCNLHDRGAVIKSDLFYLLVVQLGFGMTNGWLGSSCMISAPDYVNDGEREAAGSFMGLMLVAGLTVGSIASFGLGNL